MTFCAFPKHIKTIITGRRVVLNDQNVNEFAEYDQAENKRIPLSSSSFNKQSRFSKFLSGSPRNAKNHNQTSAIQLSTQNQTPILANNSSTNPFFENGFPVDKLFFKSQFTERNLLWKKSVS
jgi:hypothetical protein